MKKIFILFAGLAMATMLACDPVDIGDPPTLAAFSARAVGEDQIEVSWRASDLDDDLIETENLKCMIWFATTADGLNAESLGDPDVTTEEGALSYNLVGLEPNTSYQVLVRAADRANDTSTNTNIQTVTTTEAGDGTYESPVSFNVGSAALSLVAGPAFETLDSIAVAITNGVRFYDLDNNQIQFRREVLTGATVREALLLPIQPDRDHNLLLLTDNGLEYYRNGDNLVRSTVTFSGLPRAGTLQYQLEGDEVDVFSYVTDEGRAVIYLLDNEQSSDEDVFEEHLYNIGNNNGHFALGHFDNDEFYDAVIYRNGRFSIALGEDDSLDNFEAESDIDELDSDDVGSNGLDSNSIPPRMFLLDVDADGNLDVALFVRNVSEDLTRLFVFRGEGDGTFADRATGDYDHHFFENPVFIDAGNDQRPDLLMAQTSANNVAIYFGPSSTFDASPNYFGINGQPTLVTTANLNGDGNPDLVIYDNDNERLTVLATN